MDASPDEGAHANVDEGAHANVDEGAHANTDEGAHANADEGAHANADEGAHIGAPLPMIIQWFKTMTTNAYIRGVKESNWKPFRGKLWQRNYYEHIVRDQADYNRIAKYIIENPLNWKGDKNNR